jgi:carboxyl-terminal processing protease
LTVGAFAAGTRLRDSGAGQFTLKSSVGQMRLAQGGDGEAGYAFRGTPSASAGERLSEDDAPNSRRTFETIYSLVQQYYVDKLPADKQLSRGAVKGMLASLNDPNCYFLEPEQFSLIEAEQRGRYAGIGASLVVRAMPRDGYTEYKIVVAAPIPGSPAEKAGLRPGDVITHVNGRWILGYDPFLRANRMADKLERDANEAQTEEVRKEFTAARTKAQGGIGLFAAHMILRGDTTTTKRLNLPAEKIVVTAERPGVRNSISAEMTPTVTEVPPVTARTLPDGAGYVRIPAFTSKTMEQFKTALATLPKDKGIVLDLRGNPGGLTEPAIAVEGMLSSGGVFGYELRPGGKTNPVKPVVYSSVAHPLVVLSDKGTASVAEALAASLTEKGAATLVGAATFGDSSLQTAYSLPDGSAFVLATGKMLGPRRADWAGVGLTPKVAIAQGVPDDQWLRRAAEALRQRPRVAEKN